MSPLRDFEGQFKRLQASALRDGKAFTLTLEDYQQIAQTYPRCHYCVAYLQWERRRRFKKVQAHNLDRKDNARGYEPGNVVPCCDRCNRSKGNRWTYEEWLAMTARYRMVGSLVPEPERVQRDELLTRAMELIGQARGIEVSIVFAETQGVTHVRQRLQ